MSFADGFVMYATAGKTQFRYVAASLDDARAWKLAKELDGYTVSMPRPFEADGDNLYELRKDGAA